MIKRRLFKNLRKKKLRNFVILSLLFLLFLLFFYLSFKKDTYFIIPMFNDSFYLIPEDKGGKKISNQDKKALHLTYTNNEDQLFINDPILEYSFQLMANEDYNFIIEKKNSFLLKNDTIFLPNELFVAILKNDLGNEYLLLYKNFTTRSKAQEHCDKYIYFLDKCIIVNAKNLDCCNHPNIFSLKIE